MNLCRPLRPAVAPLLGALALLFAATAPLRADDRDFVRKSAENPYVFLLFDVSGSMNWTTQCTAQQLADGDCSQVCTTGDCFTPLNADSPASKFYQAKEALYEVLAQVDSVQFGFATYNQDHLGVRGKHWLYRAIEGGGSIGGLQFPALGTADGSVVGALEVFGLSFNCDSGGAANFNNATDTEVACYGNTTDAAVPGDAWEITRLHRVPKLGQDGTGNTTVYLQTGAEVYRITYKPVTGEVYGTATFKALIDVHRCSTNNSDEANENCSAAPTAILTDQEVTYALVDEFLGWEAGNERNERQQGFFAQASGSDTDAGGTCSGWDSNAWDGSATTPVTESYENLGNDPDGDPAYNLRWPTSNLADSRGRHFFFGDVIPLDWQADHKQDILERLGPGGRHDQSPLFNDQPLSGQTYLRLKNENQRPLLAFGSTPLGASIESFRNWWAGCPQGSCAKNTGWKEIAAARDPDWGCRKRYLIVLTDGDETCGGGNSACSNTAALNAQETIKTYVVAFGVQGGGTTLTCMASNGGTGVPIYPQNKQELVDALTKIFTEIREETRAFASAAVPSVEANVKDKIYLSDFTPLTSESIWDGHLDAFLKPLEVNVDGTPKETPCSGTRTFACHLWDAGDVLLTQAPTLTQAQAGNLKLGMALDQRRVLVPDEAGTLQLFDLPSTPTEWRELFRGLGFENADSVDPILFAANEARGTTVIENTLAIKEATVNTTAGTFDIEFVLGDVFHSDPLVMESPNSLDDFAENRFGTGAPCSLAASADPGYKCFAFKNQFRRKLLFVGANDTQLHAIDAGTFDDNLEAFSNGTGREAFSYIPRIALPIVRQQAEGNLHIYGLDGAVTLGDAFFTGDEGWHTMLVGGMREGGRRLGGAFVLKPEAGAPGSEPMWPGYYALDLTQPDPLDEETAPDGTVTRFIPTDDDPIPGCTSVDGVSPSGCPRPFPKLLWEFTDLSPVNGVVPMDEDANGQRDFGAPWSKPIITRLRLRETDGSGNSVEVTRFVVIVGGGLDPSAKTVPDPGRGNWVYILDAETGVPIYKRQVEGSVPAIAALDADSDSYVDVIYFGTTAGRLYKIDVSTPQPLQSIVETDRNGTNTTVERVTASEWDPFVVFRTGEDHPIYQQVQILFLARLGRFGLVFGTGDREDLWNFDGIAGRLYVIVDEGFTQATVGLPFDELDYHEVTPDGPELAATTNLLFDPTAGTGINRGWFMILDPDERVITKAFGVSGILIFSSFQPQIIITEEGQGNNAEQFCSRTGRSRNFVVFTANGNALTDLDVLDDGSSLDPGADRYNIIDDFVTSPFVEQAHTQNVTGEGVPPGEAAPTAEMCTNDGRLAAITNVLKSQGPSNARYGNYYLRLGQRESRDRGIFYAACIPIAVMQRNWREN